MYAIRYTIAGMDPGGTTPLCLHRTLSPQVSRLSERLAAAEAELIRVKRSCQFTALTEMRSTGEEYVYEVRRHR